MMDTSKKKPREEEAAERRHELYFPPRPGTPGRGEENWWLIKIGGSLFDRPGLGSQLQAWLAEQPTKRLLLIPGGGTIVEALRVLDQRHQLGEEASHWLAIGGMSLMARVLAAILPGSAVVPSFPAAQEAWSRQEVPILNVMAFLQEDEAQEHHLPHAWAVTSDSIAARFAVVHRAAKLVLLKSCPVPMGINVKELAARGVVDAWFPRVAREAAEVEVVELGDTP